jgi:hypothetical protein
VSRYYGAQAAEEDLKTAAPSKTDFIGHGLARDGHRLRPSWAALLLLDAPSLTSGESRRLLDDYKVPRRAWLE